MSDSIPTQLEAPIDTARKFLTAIISGDGPGMVFLTTDDFTWRILPAALRVPVRNRREYLLQSAELGSLYESLKIDLDKPLDVVQNDNEVVLHLAGEGKLASGSVHQMEYIMIFRCKGGKVSSMMEFGDGEVLRAILEAGGGIGFELVRREYKL
ncbi:hypothetical protein B0H11DRAFT_937875 [Mycena galericulata]|nr:hypothetical protein B0H11DRAFT_937875 [Mycena galericulata]